MSWSCEKAAALVTVLAISQAAGCWVNQGPPDEVCNYRDDDWTGIADDPFIDSSGRYVTPEHCGTCGTSCDEVFPTAAGTDCLVPEDGGTPYCVVTECPDGQHVLPELDSCVPDFDVQCLQCENDRDCQLGDPESQCVVLNQQEGRCLRTCEGETCPEGFDCRSGVCLPTSGSCECTPAQEGSTFGCWIESPSEDLMCPGERTCDGLAMSECVPQLEDVCDGQDNNCDGLVDEDFVAYGHYVDDDHCGACNNPCVPPASNMSARCVLHAFPVCEYECLPNFVDVDGVALNGCECEMKTVEWPPLALGGDGNCDGVLDDLSDYVFVSKNGNDGNPGTLDLPVLTIGQGISLAAPTGKTVFVSQGVYNEEVHLVAGVSVFGGYQTNFQDRDPIVYEVTIAHTSGPAGRPALWAEDIFEETEIAGFTVRGTDAIAQGTGSTAVLVRSCSSDLEAWDLTVFAGKGANGVDGDSSSAILNDLGVISLSQLDGAGGSTGGGGVSAWSYNCFGITVGGGSGGPKVCPVSTTDVSGGDGGDSTCPATGCTIGSPCGNAGCSDYTVGGVCDFDAVYAAAVPNPPAGDGSGPGAGVGGDITYDAPTTISGVTFCDDNPTLRREGGPGEDGADGTDGGGGDGFLDPDGFFDSSTAIWTSGDGGDGNDGNDGGGGGGGTQGNGYDRIAGAASTYHDQLGGAGGGGGSGGCGSPGARGGTGGGGSIGIAVFLTAANEGPAFSDTRVVPATAGDGGDGGVGASGGMPGAGGLGGQGNFWCARRGGKGGDGGRGGAGGGGGGGGGGSVSGFHVVPGPWGSPAGYILALTSENSVDALPAPGSGGSGGYSPGDPGESGVSGTSIAFRLYDPE